MAKGIRYTVKPVIFDEDFQEIRAARRDEIILGVARYAVYENGSYAEDFATEAEARQAIKDCR